MKFVLSVDGKMILFNQTILTLLAGLMHRV
ncbi:Uncharacterised protein [Serratia quinivorans]|nr:Uncharacterised protein [Serratia quinivorans]